MNNTTRRGPRGWLLLFSLAALALFAPPARPADVDKVAGSLKLVPADAEVYSVMLRNAEQWKAITSSKAWKKLTEMEAVQMVWQEAQKQLNDPKNPLGQFLKAKENQELLDLLADMVSSEIFFYAPAGFSDFLALMSAMQAAQYKQSFAPLFGGGQPTPEDQFHAILTAFKEQKDKFKAPNFVWGFRLEDTKRAKAQLGRLEKLLGDLVDQVPPLKGRFKTTEVGGNRFLTLTFDGKMVPWDDIPFNRIEKKAGEFDDLVKKLKELKLTIALGLRGEYLLLSVGESTAPVASLGGDKTLADRDELKPLAKYAEKKLTSVSYVSKGFHSKAGFTKADLKNVFESFLPYLDQADLTKEQKQKLHKDLTALAKDIETRVPEPGASLSFAFRTERGAESYTYDWARHPDAPAQKALTLLDHVGGNPLIAALGRSSSSGDNYKLLAKWVRVADGYVDELLLPKLDAGSKQHAEQVLKVLRPLGRRFDEVTTKMLIPSLDGQAGFVLDAKMTSKQWIPQLPNSARPLALPEPSFLYGVRDADLLAKALGEYRQLLNKALKEIAAGQAADLEVPPAKTEKIKGGTLYYYPLPGFLGIDERIAPNAGIGEKVAVFSLAPSTTKRLLAKTPFKGGGLLAKSDRPMISATYVNVKGLFEAIGPWVEYGLETAFDNGALPKEHQESVLKQVRTVVEVLSVLRSSTSYTTVEGRATVTHSEMVIRDLGE
ncbi:MAG: hypothetical protein HYS12_15750 [Planctomycetes bacterium]|nr:hypothetical protein [Planctomycetota bacterium]